MSEQIWAKGITLPYQHQGKHKITYRVKRTCEVDLSLGQGHEMDTFDMGFSIQVKRTLFLCFTTANEC
jgi:hypothetical protein